MLILNTMNKDKAYIFTAVWAFFVGVVHTGRKYFAYMENGQEEMTEWKVLALHFIPTFGIFLLIGLVLVFIYFKFIKKD